MFHPQLFQTSLPELNKRYFLSFRQKCKEGRNRTGTYTTPAKKQEITQGGSRAVGPTYGW